MIKVTLPDGSIKELNQILLLLMLLEVLVKGWQEILSLRATMD